MYPAYLHNEYGGLYVATLKFNDYNVIASGKDIAAVLRAAKAKGIDKPVIFYVPEKDTVNIYHVD